MTKIQGSTWVSIDIQYSNRVWRNKIFSLDNENNEAEVEWITFGKTAQPIVTSFKMKNILILYLSFSNFFCRFSFIECRYPYQLVLLQIWSTVDTIVFFMYLFPCLKFIVSCRPIVRGSGGTASKQNCFKTKLGAYFQKVWKIWSL